MLKQSGVTIIELMIVVVIAAILLAMAAPSFRDTVLNNRLVSETNRLVAEIQLARSEAAKRGRRVILCTSNDPNAATPACNGTAGNWRAGSIVFADMDGNDGYDDGTDALIVRSRSAADSVTISASTVTTSTTSAETHLILAPEGGLDDPTGNVVFRVCDTRGASSGREVTVNPVGRPQVVVGTSAVPLSSC